MRELGSYSPNVDLLSINPPRGGLGCPEPPQALTYPKGPTEKKSVPGPGFLIIEGGFIIEFRDPNSLNTGGGL